MPTIYKLINPLTNSPYYVGYTTKDAKIRLMGHLVQPTATTKYLIECGHKPLMEVIESGDYVTKETETHWIKLLHLKGYSLDNKDGIVVYQNRDYIFNIPGDLLNSIEMSKEERLLNAIELTLEELPLSSNVPIILRIKTILEWAIGIDNDVEILNKN